jgi:hypothetical protein
MAKSHDVEQAGSKFSQVLETAAKLPGVRINRAAYLRTALRRHCTEEQIERAIAETPAAAGIPLGVIADVANTSIKYETSKVTGLSTLAGLPGGFAMLGTIPRRPRPVRRAHAPDRAEARICVQLAGAVLGR